MMAPDVFRSTVGHFTTESPYRWWTMELVTGHWLLVRHAEEVHLRDDETVIYTDMDGIEHWFDAGSVVRIMSYTEVLLAPDDGGIPF